ncbi:phage tail assembly chaperone family protein, TAC [Ectopseudomonas composti]
MELSISGLQQVGAFTGAPVKKPISWTMNGVEHKAHVFVRKLSYASAVVDLMAYHSAIDGVAARIATSIVDSKGEPVLTVADITGEANPERGPLDADLTKALLAVIAEVNGLGKKKPPAKSKGAAKPARSPSPKPKSSGTN